MGILYGAIDLHSSNCYCGITDQKDEWVKHKRLKNRLKDVNEFFKTNKENLEGIVIESTYNGYWLIDGLMESGYKVKLASPSKMGEYEGLKNQNDKTDTRWLAKMLRLGILPESYIYPKEVRPIRDLLRKRMLFINARTKILNSIQNQFQTWLSAKIGKCCLVELSSEELYRLFEEKNLCLSAKSGTEIIKTMNQWIKIIEKKVYEQLKETKEIKRLRILPGIDRILGMTISLEAGIMSRFKTVKNYLSYCRLVEAKRMSNNKRKKNGNRKCGNKILRWAYAEAAVHALRYERINKYYQRLKKKKGGAKAMAIISSKIARVSYKVMTDDNFYYQQERLFQ